MCSLDGAVLLCVISRCFIGPTLPHSDCRTNYPPPGQLRDQSGLSRCGRGEGGIPGPATAPE